MILITPIKTTTINVSGQLDELSNLPLIYFQSIFPVSFVLYWWCNYTIYKINYSCWLKRILLECTTNIIAFCLCSFSLLLNNDVMAIKKIKIFVLCTDKSDKSISAFPFYTAWVKDNTSFSYVKYQWKHFSYLLSFFKWDNGLMAGKGDLFVY